MKILRTIQMESYTMFMGENNFGFPRFNSHVSKMFIFLDFDDKNKF